MEKYNGPERRDYAQEPWHIKREVTWGHLMSTIMLLAMLIVGWMDINEEVDKAHAANEANAAEIQHVRELDDIQNRQFRETLKEVKEQFQKIDDKLDTIIQEKHEH